MPMVRFTTSGLLLCLFDKKTFEDVKAEAMHEIHEIESHDEKSHALKQPAVMYSVSMYWPQNIDGHRSVTKESFITFVNKQVAPILTPYPGPQSVVMMDNCAIHHDKEI
ncbi:hypothetical protein C8Q80DRAFT_1121262 [Daedaleopsis nitida]|nr:hypothetical protein C8Q80DRAFT_1121262 [Daedaleopsis nitida]